MKITINIMLLLILLTSNCVAEEYRACNEDHLNTIMSDFDKSYKQYKLISNTLSCYKNNAVNGDKRAISAIISLYGIGSHNSEHTEWYAETIETMFLKAPQKLFDVLLEKDKKTIDGIMFYLENPIDGEIEAIIAVAKKLSKKSKYRILANRLINSSR